MKRTLESFQQEWYELKSEGKLDPSRMPKAPDVYLKNQQLSDELAEL